MKEVTGSPHHPISPYSHPLMCHFPLTDGKLAALEMYSATQCCLSPLKLWEHYLIGAVSHREPD